MNTTGNKSHDQDRTPPRGLPRSFRPHVPCPETVLVVVMTDNSYVLVGYPQGQPTALVTAPDAGSLHQALTEAFGPAHPTDQSASRNGTGTNTSSDRSRTRAAGQPRWEANLNPSLPGRLDMTRADHELLMESIREPDHRSFPAGRVRCEALPPRAGRTGDAGRPSNPSPVWSPTVCREEPLMAGRHRLKGRREQHTALNPPIRGSAMCSPADLC